MSEALQDACEREEGGGRAAGSEGDAGARHAELARRIECYREEIDARDHDGSSALHAAALAGRGGAVRMLLEAGADARAASHLQETPLHCAAREGHAHVVGMLVAAGAETGARDRAGRTPLELARTRLRDASECEAVAVALKL